VLGSILAAVYSDRLHPVPGAGDGAMAEAGESLGRAVEVASGLPATVGDALVAAARDAFLGGLHAVVIVSIALLAVSAVLAAIVLRRTTPGAGGQSVERDDDAAAGGQPVERDDDVSAGGQPVERDDDVSAGERPAERDGELPSAERPAERGEARSAGGHPRVATG